MMLLVKHSRPSSTSSFLSITRAVSHHDYAFSRQPVRHPGPSHPYVHALLFQVIGTLTGDNRIDSINGAAGAGFRLSLVLNAVRMKMASADLEITKISKGISDFSLMLKQVARAMEEGGVIATPLAIDTVFDIKDHSEHVFEEIKSMTELAQVRDEKGILTEIDIGNKVTWCFKKQKVPYLLGQLDHLRLNLAIMLQILHLAKSIAPNRYAISVTVIHATNIVLDPASQRNS